jgi:hypothetical protein
MTGGHVGCNKMRFASRGAVKKYIREVKRNNVGFAAGMPYACLSPSCPVGTWHLTSQTKRQARIESRRYEARRLEARGLAGDTGS